MAIMKKGNKEETIRVNTKVKLKATAAHPYRKEGEIFPVHPAGKDKQINNGWAVEETESTEKAKPAKEIKTAEVPAANTEPKV